MKNRFRVQRLDGDVWYGSSKWPTLEEAQNDVRRLKKDDPVFEYKIFVLVERRLIMLQEAVQV